MKTTTRTTTTTRPWLRGYTPKQMLRYHAHCKANPASHVLPPGGRAGWDDMTAAAWLRWFAGCLVAKTIRGTEAAGKGNRAVRRAKTIADRAAECRWCGQKTGSASRRFCCDDCCRCYRS